MELRYKNIRLAVLAALIISLTIASCKDNYPMALDTSSQMVVLNTIKLVNTGANGNTVLEGVIDENTKTVTFPRIDTLTNFANLKFEAKVSDGAKLSQEVYPVSFGKGESEKVITIKVANEPRFRDYLVKLRLKVAVFGAEFETFKTYDFTANPLGNPLYDAFTAGLTRGSGFDGEKVLIVTRGADGPHLLNVSDLKNGVINKIKLNLTGVAGGTFAYNMGAQVNGHTYIANLSSNAPTNPVKVYHWTNPASAPQLIANVDISGIAGVGARHGDNFSASLDNLGNGYFFFGDNPGSKILRLTVTNFTTVSNPTVFATPVALAGSWISYNRIGNTGEYLFTGHDAPIALVSEGGAAAFTMSRTAIPVRSSDARVVYFNGERYLIVTTAARTGAESTNFLVFNITNGADVKEALTNLNNQPAVNALFNYSLMGPVNGSPASQTGFYVKKDAQGKDESLMLYSGASDTGFVIFEFAKKEAKD